MTVKELKEILNNYRECSLCGKISDILVTHPEGFVFDDCIGKHIQKQTEKELGYYNNKNKK